MYCNLHPLLNPFLRSYISALISVLCVCVCVCEYMWSVDSLFQLLHVMLGLVESLLSLDRGQAISGFSYFC